MPRRLQRPPQSLARARSWCRSLSCSARRFKGPRGQMSSYPFACYPTFQWIPPLVMPDLRVVGVDATGAAHELGPARRGIVRTQRQWAEIWSLAGVTAPIDGDRLAAYFEALRRSERATLTARVSTAIYRSVRARALGRTGGRRAAAARPRAQALSGMPRSRSGVRTFSSSDRAASARYSSESIQPSASPIEAS